MTGVDDLVSIEAVIIGIVLLYFSDNIINALLITCMASFLFWNRPRQKYLWEISEALNFVSSILILVPIFTIYITKNCFSGFLTYKN